MKRVMMSLVVLGCMLFASQASADRLKELADLDGARANQLVGYGLVVGLAGTGDDASAPFSAESIVTMLERMGTQIDASRLRLRNVAGVMVTAELPAFVRPGQSIDVTVSSIGTAKSLEGGTLIMTPLKGPDMQVYAVAQGALSIGGFSASGASGSSVAKGHPTVARVPNGALVEREVPVDLMRPELHITLRTPDFTTAIRIADKIQAKLAGRLDKKEDPKGKKGKKGKDDGAKGEAAGANEESFVTTRDAGTIVVRVPERYGERIPMLMAELEALEVTPDDPVRVVINERTGTVVLGSGVRLSAVAIAHGGLTVEIQESSNVSQPNAGLYGGGAGNTVVTPETAISVTEGGGQLHTLTPGASLSEVVRALNAIGVTPRDLVAIMQALKAAGALHAELDIQ